MNPCLGHAHPLDWLRFLRGGLACGSSLNLDFEFYFFNELKKVDVVLKLALRVNQLQTVCELDPFARITKPAHPHDPLQSLSGA